MTGGWVESYPEDVKAILAAGHDLGNHSENHKNMSQLSDSECEEELMAVHNKVLELTGYEMLISAATIRFSGMWILSTGKIMGWIPLSRRLQSISISATAALSSVITAPNIRRRRWKR